MNTIKAFLCIFAIITAFKLATNVEETVVIERYQESNISIFQELDIQCPEVVYAQMILETNFFRSKIFKQNNNMFGMKTNSRSYDRGELNGHAKYDNTLDSILDYKEWQDQMSGGKKFKDNEEYLKFLKQVGYAEDPKYTEKLQEIIKLIQKNEHH